MVDMPILVLNVVKPFLHMQINAIAPRACRQQVAKNRIIVYGIVMSYDTYLHLFTKLDVFSNTMSVRMNLPSKTSYHNSNEYLLYAISNIVSMLLAYTFMLTHIAISAI